MDLANQGEALVGDFLAFCETSGEILSIDRLGHSLVAKSMNAPLRPSVRVQLDPDAMAAACGHVEGFTFEALEDASYRNEIWGEIFQEMLERVEIVSFRSAALRLTNEGPFEEI